MRHRWRGRHFCRSGRWRFLGISLLIAFDGTFLASCSGSDQPPALPEEDGQVTDVRSDGETPTDGGELDRSLVELDPEADQPDRSGDEPDLVFADTDSGEEPDVTDDSNGDLFAELYTDAADDGGHPGGLVLSSLGFNAGASASLSNSFTLLGRISASTERSSSASWSLIGGF